MPLRRLPDVETWTSKPPCRNPDHDPPSMIVLKPGRYEHTCPACGKKTVFTVKKPMLNCDYAYQLTHGP